MDRPLLDAGGLQMPSTSLRGSLDAAPLDCNDFIHAYPNTLVELKPNAFEVHLIVPTQAMRAPQAPAEDFHRGGTA
ncbi:hypothetical protein, partial [Mesorhizobium japonicum]|uniref:hypothetical protein n=1 Tax=Mesorhizobium japonicum TaxID=2066070 RepID=UPI003B5B9165